MVAPKQSHNRTSHCFGQKVKILDTSDASGRQAMKLAHFMIAALDMPSEIIERAQVIHL